MYEGYVDHEWALAFGMVKESKVPSNKWRWIAHLHFLELFLNLLYLLLFDCLGYELLLTLNLKDQQDNAFSGIYFDT